MSQQKAVKLLRASAGSGKTFALTAQYLILLFSGKGKYREILAVTFTNKATAEMKERILGSLQELALTGYQKSKFSQVLQSVYPELSDTDIRQRASEIYSSILHDYSRFSVSTIDRFVQQLIRSFAFELNLDSGYKLEMNQNKVKEDLVEALNLYLEKDEDLLSWVTNLAIDRISEGKDWDYHRALMDLADEIFKERYSAFDEAMKAMGAGRSNEFNKLQKKVKTESDEFRDEIVRKATEIKKIFDTSGIEPDDLNLKTRNPLFKLTKIIAEDFSGISSFEDFADNFDRWPNSKLKDTSDLMQLYNRIGPLLKDLLDYYNSGIVMFETYRAISKNSPYLRLMQGMAELLTDYRSDKKLLLLSDAQRLLKGVTGNDAHNPSFIWEKTGNKFKNFLFDEFQDTSTFQWENFLPLLQNAIAESAVEKYADHLVVGDVKQSIYRWRNGDWRILHQQVKRDLSPVNVNEETLVFNRRSSQNIIRFNNFLYKSLPEFLQNQLNEIFAETAPEYLHPYWEEKGSLIQRAYEGSHQQTTESTPAGGKIEIKFFMKTEEPDGEEEHSQAAFYTVEKLAELLELGIAMKDIGILVRKNSEAQQILECVFEKNNQEKLSRAAGKPFQVISGEALKIMNNPAVSLLLSTFRLLSVHEPESGIYKAECARLWYQILNPDAEEIALETDIWISFPAMPVSSLPGVLPEDLCSSFNSLRYLPVNELTEKLIKMYRLGTAGTENHIPYLLAFRDQVAVFSSAGDQGIGAFVKWWDAEGSVKALPSSENQDAVQIMTVHKSKGLEFGAVIVPFLNWKLNEYSNPGKRKLLWVGADQAGFERFNSFPVDYNKNLASTVFAGDFFDEMLLNYMDELNALYVATTRAKDYLCLICPKTPAKKKDSKSGPPNELHYILHQMFEEKQTADLIFDEADNSFSFGEISAVKIDKEEEDHTHIRITSYPVNEELTERFKRNSRNEETWFNSKQRKGVVLHKLLEILTSQDDLDKLISEKVQEGFIRESEKQEIRKDVEDILMQEEIKHWFATAKLVISEKDMIIEAGLVKRPDKLFAFDDRAVLLDFKFGAEQNKYINDISLYRDNLLRMDEFKEVDAYLWYAEGRKLQKV